MSDELPFEVMRRVAARMIQQRIDQSSTPVTTNEGTIDVLAQVAQLYLSNLAYQAKELAEVAGRTQSNALDVLGALEDTGVNLDNLFAYGQEMVENSEHSANMQVCQLTDKIGSLQIEEIGEDYDIYEFVDVPEELPEQESKVLISQESPDFADIQPIQSNFTKEESISFQPISSTTSLEVILTPLETISVPTKCPEIKLNEELVKSDSKSLENSNIEALVLKEIETFDEIKTQPEILVELSDSQQKPLEETITHDITDEQSKLLDREITSEVDEIQCRSLERVTDSPANPLEEEILEPKVKKEDLALNLNVAQSDSLNIIDSQPKLLEEKGIFDASKIQPKLLEDSIIMHEPSLVPSLTQEGATSNGNTDEIESPDHSPSPFLLFAMKSSEEELRKFLPKMELPVPKKKESKTKSSKPTTKPKLQKEAYSGGLKKHPSFLLNKPHKGRSTLSTNPKLVNTDSTKIWSSLVARREQFSSNPLENKTPTIVKHDELFREAFTKLKQDKTDINQLSQGGPFSTTKFNLEAPSSNKSTAAQDLDIFQTPIKAIFAETAVSALHSKFIQEPQKLSEKEMESLGHVPFPSWLTISEIERLKPKVEPPPKPKLKIIARVSSPPLPFSANSPPRQDQNELPKIKIRARVGSPQRSTSNNEERISKINASVRSPQRPPPSRYPQHKAESGKLGQVRAKENIVSKSSQPARRPPPGSNPRPRLPKSSSKLGTSSFNLSSKLFGSKGSVASKSQPSRSERPPSSARPTSRPERPLISALKKSYPESQSHVRKERESPNRRVRIKLPGEESPDVAVISSSTTSPGSSPERDVKQENRKFDMRDNNYESSRNERHNPHRPDPHGMDRDRGRMDNRDRFESRDNNLQHRSQGSNHFHRPTGAKIPSGMSHRHSSRPVSQKRPPRSISPSNEFSATTSEEEEVPAPVSAPVPSGPLRVKLKLNPPSKPEQESPSSPPIPSSSHQSGSRLEYNSQPSRSGGKRPSGRTNSEFNEQKLPKIKLTIPLPPVPKLDFTKGYDNEVRDEINCFCETPHLEDFKFMVSCNQCLQWFHGACLNFQGDKDVPSTWYCPRCIKRNSGSYERANLREDDSRNPEFPSSRKHYRNDDEDTYSHESRKKSNKRKKHKKSKHSSRRPTTDDDQDQISIISMD